MLLVFLGSCQLVMALTSTICLLALGLLFVIVAFSFEFGRSFAVLALCVVAAVFLGILLTFFAFAFFLLFEKGVEIVLGA